ncbi:MAG: large repetitive protein [Acidobacteriota bacterium]|jgi:protocatechuate 3,4-dioxygenase beta subunit|nr:large repetitive protein [Acidobacteriota bacterium]
MSRFARVLSLTAALAFLAGDGIDRAAATDLGAAQLLIAGTRLAVDPAQQTVPFDTGTLVNTHLQGYDATRGTLPPSFKVVGDLTGPEIDGVLTLETVPNQPFRIPRLTLKGDYRLDNVRLVDGRDLLAFSEPRSVGILVTQILVTRVESRPLTADEIRAKGIVIDEDNFRAVNFTFGFAVAPGKVVEQNVGLIFPNDDDGLGGLFDLGVGSGGNDLHIPFVQPFEPPRIAFTRLEPQGCEEGCGSVVLPPIPAAIVLPFDNLVLNQFFSVLLLAQNGAPAGDRLVLRDLTADIKLPVGLRPARTEPPTPLGVPVPVREPGHDGVLGTADDDARLAAQETGQAEFLVEGLREGNHLVDIDIAGILEGLPTGLQPVSGHARGAVLVRNPTFGVVLEHPRKVAVNQEYFLRLSVTNTSRNAIANLLTITLPTSGVAGADVIGSNQAVIDTLKPGETRVVKFHLRARVEGRVVATAIRAGSDVSAAIQLTNEVGLIAPTAPNSIVLPAEAESLPDGVTDSLFTLLSQAFTVATTPRSALGAPLPEVSRAVVEARSNDLARAGRYHALGEDLFDSTAILAAEWTGARDHAFDWDELRRATPEGAAAGFALSTVLAEEAARTSPAAAFERLFGNYADLPPMAGALAVGDGAELEIVSRVTGSRLFATGVRNDRARELPFADLYGFDGAQMALLAVPETEGYQVRLRTRQAGSPDLQLVLPRGNGSLGVARFNSLPAMSAGGLAVVDFQPGSTQLVLSVDVQGDGVVDAQQTVNVEALPFRPFAAVHALQNAQADGSGHVVDVLFSREVDLRSLLPIAEGRFRVAGKVSNGGLTADEQAAIPNADRSRIVRVIFDNPLSPFVPQTLTIDDVKSVGGAVIHNQAIAIASNLTAPGIQVTGRVIGPDGQPLPLAYVELFEFDRSDVTGECTRHRTATVQADAGGQYTFDYVRQTSCGGDFQMRAVDPDGTSEGLVRDRVRTAGATVRVDIVMIGRGVIRGHVRYDDGTIPPGATVQAFQPVLNIGKLAAVDAQGNFEVRNVPVGTVTLLATDKDGNFVAATLEVPQAGSMVTKDLTILRRPGAALGTLRGRVLTADGSAPVFRAWVLIEAGAFRTFRYTDADGRWEVEQVPAGAVSIHAFSSETGISGGTAAVNVVADSVTEVDILLLDQRGTVEGHVYVETPAGWQPAVGAIVWANGTPVNTVTNAEGFYHLSGVPVGEYVIGAVDHDQTMSVSAPVSLTQDGQTVLRDLVFRPVLNNAAIAGEVLDVDGHPVSGATVHTQFGLTQWLYEARTGADGRFLIADVPPGTYTVHGFRGGDGAKATVDVIASGQTAFVSIRFKKGTIRGQVRSRQDDGSFAGVRSFVTYSVPSVKFGLVSNWDTLTIETDDSGHFELRDVLIGPYSLTVRNPFYGSKSVNGELTSQGDTAEHTFDFEPNGTIRGVVRNPDGTPAEGAKVNLRHPNFASFEVVTDTQGQFRFELVPPAANRFPVEAFFEKDGKFRKAQVWVDFTRRGQVLDVEITLPKQGMVMGFVENQLGQRMPGLTVTLTEGSYPRRQLQQVSDATGAFSFSNVFVGPVSVTVASLDRISGGKASGDLLDESQTLTFRIPVRVDIAEIRGRVLSPVDGKPVPSVQLELSSFSLHESQVATAEGDFDFVSLPPGTYTLRAFDPSAGRAGQLERLVVVQGQALTADLTLEARGSVQGTLTDPDTQRPVAGETVRLTSSGIFYFSTYSSTDSTGAFAFGGIPQGRFDLFARETGGRRYADANGEIVRENEVVTAPLAWQATSAILGRVLAGDGATVFPGPVSVALSEQRPFYNYYSDSFQLIAGSQQNPYRLPGLVQGRSFYVEASEQGGRHRGRTDGFLNVGEPTRTVDVRMVGLATVSVRVQDSFGNPVPGADVFLTSNGFYGNRYLAANADAGGEARFFEIGEGAISATARHPVSGLRGSASAQVRFDAQTLPIVITLEDTGRVFGLVVRSDGTTPAANALVSLKTGGRELLTFAGADGAYEFPAVPLGTFTVAYVESAGPGLAQRAGSVTANGQAMDLGTVVLDDAPPAIQSVTPGPGAIGLPVTTQPVIRFSEPIDVTKLPSDYVTLSVTGGSRIFPQPVWSEGNTVLTLQLSSGLSSLTSYQLRVDANLRDLAGRRLGSVYQSSFTTADVQPPQVVFFSPQNNAVNVATDAQFRVVFSEPVDPASLAGNFLLVRTGTGEALPLRLRLQPDGREVQVDQLAPLAAETRYTLTVQGVRDLGGNAMTAPAVTAFRTVDVTPPELFNPSPGAGTVFLSGDTIGLSVFVTDNLGLAQVRITLGGQVKTMTASGIQGYFTAEFPAPSVTDPQDVTVVFEAFDTAGNRTAKSWTVRVEPVFDPNRPTIDVLCPGSRVVLAPGTAIDLQLQVADDQGVDRVDLFLGDATTPLATQSRPANSLTMRFTLPASVVDDQDLALRAVVRDFAGGSAEKRIQVKVVEGTVFTQSTTVDENNLSYEGRSVIVSSGVTLTLSGHHALRDLVVLGGGKVTHPLVTAASPGGALDLAVARDVYVACGGVVSADSRSSLATAGNPTADSFRAGSYGGRGARYTGAGAIFGSLFDPRDAGRAGTAGGVGGGLVRLAAGGAVRVDGTLSADGSYLGTGGSIRLDAQEIAGTGGLHAQGGEGGNEGGGGGGRIALYAPTIDDGLLARTSVKGGGSSGAFPERQGAAGTLYLKRPSQADGELTIDNAGRAALLPLQTTELPAIGRGTVDAVNGSTITDADASFPAGVVGHSVTFGDDLTHLWRVVARTATTLTLDTAAAPLTAAPGAAYRGVLKLDRFFVRGAANAMSIDAVVTPAGGVTIASGAAFLNDPGPAPTIILTVPLQVYGELPLSVHTQAADASGLLRVELDVAGAVTAAKVYTPEGAPSGAWDDTFPTPHVTAPGTITVKARAYDAYRLVTTTTATVALVPDTVPPALGEHQPADGTVFSSGDAIHVTADVTDNVRLTGVDFAFNGQTRHFFPNEIFDWTVTAPVVTAETPLAITLTATDSSGNVATFTIPLVIRPHVNTNIPVVAVACPSPGARVAPGTGLDVQVEATDDEAVDRVEVYLDGVLAGTDALAPYSVRVTAPAGAAVGSTLTVRAVAYDFAGNSSEVAVPLTVVNGFKVSGNTTISASDFGLDGLSLVVTSGTLTIDGAHTFADLVVLDGARVTNGFTGTTVLGKPVNLTLTGSLYLACGARIDTTGQGYGQGMTYPNVSAPFSRFAGGSHGGRGQDSIDPPYGSLFEPQEPGAGGIIGNSLLEPPGSGGGVVRVSAQGPMLIDGAILANGTPGFGNFTKGGDGAGGSIRLAATSLAGRGVVQADSPGNGGGGRIALYVDTVDPGMLSRVTAVGSGGGTIYIKQSGQAYGDLIVDAGNRQPTTFTELVSVGRGTIGSVTSATSSSLTDPAKQFRFSVVGDRVAVGGNLAELWRVASHAPLGSTLTLDAAGNPAGHPFTGQAGQAYEGVYRFDHVTVRGGAHLLLDDRLISTTPPVVAEGSTVLDGSDPAAPPKAAVNVYPGPGIVAGQGISLLFAASSLTGLDRLEVTVSGAVADSQVFAINGGRTANRGSYHQVPADAVGQPVTVVLRAVDTAGRTTEVQRTFTVAPDTHAPVISLSQPSAGTQATAGSQVRIAGKVADDVAVTSYTVELGGLVITFANTSATSFDLTLAAPPVAAPSLVPVTIVARDAAGNESRFVRNIRVLPLADPVPPQLSLLCPGEATMAAAGRTIKVKYDVDNDVHHTSFYLGDDPQPVAVSFGDYYPVEILIPNLPDGTQLVLRARATDYGNNTVERTLPVTVRTGTMVTADRTLAAGDASLNGQPLIVANGATLTVDGPHAFQSLLVLDGGKVTHPKTDATTVHRLELTVAGDVFVGCDAAITADALGYRGAKAQGELAYTYPNVPLAYTNAGSHGGEGGYGGAVYDNVFDPREPGGGGGTGTVFGRTEPGGDGGGVILVTAGGPLVNQGVISADGEQASAGGSGAGGTVRLAAASLSGPGSITASGGGSTDFFGTSGGGGRIALYAATVEDRLIGNTHAAGGWKFGGLSQYHRGSAGTLFVKRDAAPFGDLIVDNSGRGTLVSLRATALPSVGAGFVDAVTATSITDDQATFSPSVAGVSVSFNDDLTQLWPITAAPYQGHILTLRVEGHPLTAHVGDAYRGVYRFDRVIIRGHATASVNDRVLVTEPPQVETGSRWLPSDNSGSPVIDAAKIRFDLGVFGLTLVGDPGAVTDPDTPITLEVRNLSSDLAITLEAAADGSFSTPIAGANGDRYSLVATDASTPPLASQTVEIGPLAGDFVSPVLDTGDAVAVGDGAAAVCESCFYNSEVRARFDMQLYDLSDPANPVAAARFNFSDNLPDPSNFCYGSCDSSYSRCDELGGDPVCYAAGDACYNSCGDGNTCANACKACSDYCTANAGGPGCLDACSLCVQTCSVPPAPADVETRQIPASVDGMVIGGGVLAFTQGPFLRVADVRDPSRPILRDSTQLLELIPNVSPNSVSLAMDLVDGYLHLIRQGPPNTYFVVDVHDPQHPRLVSSVDLAVRGVSDLEVRDGVLHLLSDGTGAAAEYRLFAIGDPAAPLLRTASGFGASARRGSGLEVVGDVGVYTLQGQPSAATFHRSQPASDAPHTSALPFEGSHLIEAGDKVLVLSDSEAAVCALDPSYGGHGLTVEQQIATPVASAKADVVGGILWLEPSYGQAQGYPSSLVRPWLEAKRLTTTVDAAGGHVTGATGAALGAALVTANVAGATVTAPVAADGSFSLALGVRETGERVTLQAADATGHRANKVRLDLPAGAPAGALDLAAGASRWSLDNGLAAVVPSVQAAGTVTVTLASLTASNAPTAAGTVTVNGPVADAVVAGPNLYVAGARLTAFAIDDPAQPQATATLDLFGGRPVQSLALTAAGDLVALGASATGLELRILTRANPDVPVAAATVALPAITAPRLVADDSTLWVIGDGQARRYLLQPGQAPLLEATGSFAGSRLAGVASFAGTVYAAVANQGVRELVTAGNALTLGPAPVEPIPALGLFRLASPAGGERLWWAEGLGGAKTLLRTEQPAAGVNTPIYGHLQGRCAVRDAATVAGDLYLLTDCGIEKTDR